MSCDYNINQLRDLLVKLTGVTTDAVAGLTHAAAEKRLHSWALHALDDPQSDMVDCINAIRLGVLSESELRTYFNAAQQTNAPYPIERQALIQQNIVNSGVFSNEELVEVAALDAPHALSVKNSARSLLTKRLKGASLKEARSAFPVLSAQQLYRLFVSTDDRATRAAILRAQNFPVTLLTRFAQSEQLPVELRQIAEQELSRAPARRPMEYTHAPDAGNPYVDEVILRTLTMGRARGKTRSRRPTNMGLAGALADAQAVLVPPASWGDDYSDFWLRQEHASRACQRLSKRGLVTYNPAEKVWRVTRAGVLNQDAFRPGEHAITSREVTEFVVDEVTPRGYRVHYVGDSQHSVRTEFLTHGGVMSWPRARELYFPL